MPSNIRFLDSRFASAVAHLARGTGMLLLLCVTTVTCHVAPTAPPVIATQLVFSKPPVTTAAGHHISVRVTAVDAQGNKAIGFADSITVALAPASDTNGAVLSGPLTEPAIAGVATFSTLTVDRVGTGYELSATEDSLTGTTSPAFDITPGSATQLEFTVQPTQTVASDSITPAVQVAALDVGGNPATSFIGNVKIVITGGTGALGAKLSGVRTVAAVAGVATFSALGIDLAGSGYTLTANSSGLTGTISAPFNITAGAATHVAFATEPTTATAGARLTPAVQISALDSSGNTDIGFAGNVTVAIAPGTGIPGAVLSGTRTAPFVNGIATFGTLSLDKAGTGYRLIATSSSLGGATSAAFSVTPGVATQLGFSVQPITTEAGHAITPTVKVDAQDAFGNTDPTYAGTVTVAIGRNAGGGTLSGPTAAAAFGGVAAFPNISINRVGIGYTLTANATGLSRATSAAFDITAGPATELVFAVQPANTATGAIITPPVKVTAWDALGNTASGFNGTVTVAIGTNPSGGTLSGTMTVTAAAGVATFSTLSIDLAGSGYTLTATTSGLPVIASTNFNIL